MTGKYIGHEEINVIKRYRKQNQTISKKHSMITWINKRNFGHKLRASSLKNDNQWQMYQLINVLFWTYLVAFTVSWHQSWQIHLQILPGVILQNLHIKLRNNLDFRVFQYCLYKKSYNCWRYTAKSPHKTTI